MVATKPGRIDYPSDVEVFVIGMIGGLSYKLTLSVPAWADFDILVMDRDQNIVGVGILGRGETEVVFITPRYTGSFLVGIGSSNGATGNFTLKLWRRT